MSISQILSELSRCIFGKHSESFRHTPWKNISLTTKVLDLWPGQIYYLVMSESNPKTSDNLTDFLKVMVFGILVCIEAINVPRVCYCEISVYFYLKIFSCVEYIEYKQWLGKWAVLTIKDKINSRRQTMTLSVSVAYCSICCSS